MSWNCPCNLNQECLQNIKHVFICYILPIADKCFTFHRWQWFESKRRWAPRDWINEPYGDTNWLLNIKWVPISLQIWLDLPHDRWIVALRPARRELAEQTSFSDRLPKPIEIESILWCVEIPQWNENLYNNK